MIWVGLVVAILVLLILIIFITKLTVEIDLYHGRDNDHLKIKFFAWFRIIRFTIDVPMVEVDKDSPSIVFKEEMKTGKKEKLKKEKKKRITPKEIINSLLDTKEILTHITQFYKIVRDFLNKVSIKKLDWKTAVGVGDASQTGVLTGAIWAIKGSIIGLISANMKLKVTPNLMVTPLFQQMASSISLQCMIQFRIGHAIIAGIKMLIFWRGGKPNFRSTLLEKTTEKSLS
ncbi:DUF2953 domain-containing protein [Bacillus carboniphilus]|uniref:DUF2953 domain-containing protein n=1 Tax=Bacillus carboniphilus TaxID=86663 RepID=A0ABN0WCQ7_9BACI